MGIFDFFKNKGKGTQKGLTLEDCIVKMFVSAGIVPNQEGNKFATVVEGKHCVFNVLTSTMRHPFHIRVYARPDFQVFNLGLGYSEYRKAA